MSQSSNLPQGSEELTKHLLNILPNNQQQSINNNNNNNNNNNLQSTQAVPSPQLLPNEASSKQLVSSPATSDTAPKELNTQSPTHSLFEKEIKKDINTFHEESITSSPPQVEKRQQSVSPNEINHLWSQLSKKLDKHQDTTMIPTQDNIVNNKKNSNIYNGDYNNEEEGQDNSSHYDLGIWTAGFFLFWFGFICPILWIIGSFWPKKVDRYGKMAHRWQMINRAMAIGFCIILICILIAMGVWYSQTGK